jgi:hypothetical protein
MLALWLALPAFAEAPAGRQDVDAIMNRAVKPDGPGAAAVARYLPDLG